MWETTTVEPKERIPRATDRHQRLPRARPKPLKEQRDLPDLIAEKSRTHPFSVKLMGESNLWTLRETKNKVLLAPSQTCNSKYDRAVICEPPNSINQRGCYPYSLFCYPPPSKLPEENNHKHCPERNQPHTLP